MKYDGIIFDLDGTLWDSTKEVAESWKTVIEAKPQLGPMPSYEDIMGVMGMSDTQLMKTLFPKLSEEEGLALFNECCQAENQYLLERGAKSYDGVREMLEELSKDYKLAIVSNCNKGYIECYLESMGVKEFFCDHECFGNTRRPKGENIRLVVERCQFKNPVYVGDTHWDMEAATFAGLPFIHAAYGFGTPGGSCPSIASPMELVSLIKNSD